MAMKPTLDQDGLTAEEAARRSLFNRITIGALILVGILGSLLMFRSVYISNQPARSKPAEQTKAAQTSGKSKPDVSVVQDSKGSHLLQLGVFSDVARAEELRGKLEKAGISSTISTGSHVFAGPFSTQEEAEATRTKLKALGLDD